MLRVDLPLPGIILPGDAMARQGVASTSVVGLGLPRTRARVLPPSR